MKTLIKQLRLWDGLWSIPLAFIGFLSFEWVGRSLWGDGFGAYDPAVFQAALMAAVILIAANTLVQLALVFNFPALWQSYHRTFFTHYESLHAWQKIFVTLFMYCFFFAAFLLVFLKLV